MFNADTCDWILSCLYFRIPFPTLPFPLKDLTPLMRYKRFLNFCLKISREL